MVSSYSVDTLKGGLLAPCADGGTTAMPKMSSESKGLLSLFDLRVLLRYDDKYRVHVAHCIETGNVVTSDTQQEAHEMMKELLEDEISFALKNRNLKNLFSSPAPLEVLLQWMKAAKEGNLQTVTLDVDFNEVELQDIEPKNAHFTNKVEFAAAA